MDAQWPTRFVVGLDKDEALVLRQLMRPVKLGEVVVIAVFAVVLYSGSLLVVTGKEMDYEADALMLVSILAALAAVVMGYFLRRTLRSEFPFPGDAFHLAVGGMTLFVAGAVHPVRLPWDAVRSLEIRRRHVRWTLTITLSDDPGTATGLDQPMVQRALLLRNRHARGLWFDVDALTQPYARIDAAVRHYSGGRVAVHSPYPRFRPDQH